MNSRLILAAAIILSLSGCAPDMTKSNNYNFETTLGEELIALKKALDEGAIDKSEYEDMKESLKKSRFKD